MASAVDKLLNIARAEIGYLEKATNANLDSKTANAGMNDWNKYARDLDKTNLYNGKKNGYWWCFTAGTKIFTDIGYKNIEDLHIGDCVLDAFGNSYNTVINVSAHVADVRELKVENIPSLWVTDDHPFMSKSSPRRKLLPDGFTQCGFNPLSSLKKNDRIAVPHTINISQTTIDDDIRWLAGFYTANGYRSDNEFIVGGPKRVLEIFVQRKNTTGRFREGFEDAASNEYAEYVLNVKDNRDLKYTLWECGTALNDKLVPNSILHDRYEAKVEYMSGFKMGIELETYPKREYRKELLLGLQRLDTDIRYHDEMKDDVNKLLFIPIEKIGIKTHKDIVYTITVDGNHTYTANNLAVHNCDIFCDWCYVQAFGFDTAVKMTFQPLKGAGAGCTYSAQYYKKAGRFFKTPKPGDQIFFTSDRGKTYYHTGLVESVTATTVTTIEGNTTSNPGVVRNGGAVNRKTYKLTNSQIGGYGRPNWDLVGGAGTISTPSSTTNTTVTTYNPYSGEKNVIVANAAAVNVRSGPGINYSVLTTVTKNTKATIIGVSTDGKWFYINYNAGANGWIFHNYIAPISDTSSTVPSVKPKNGVVTASALNVRKGPGISYVKIDCIKKGTTVTINETNGKWYKISYGAKTGWVNSAFIQGTTVTTVYKTTTANLNMRKGRGTAYGIICTIPKGTKVVVSDLASGWYKVTYNSKVGYCNAKYFK